MLLGLLFFFQLFFFFTLFILLGVFLLYFNAYNIWAGCVCIFIYIWIFNTWSFFLKKSQIYIFAGFCFVCFFLKIFKDHIRWVPAWKSGFLLEKHTPRAKQQENDETINYWLFGRQNKLTAQQKCNNRIIARLLFSEYFVIEFPCTHKIV